MRYFLVGLMLATMLVGFSACETTEGVGQDMENLGNEVDSQF